MISHSDATFLDAPALLETENNGVLWGGQSDDLNVTLLSWPHGEGVAQHVNTEVDVLLVVLHGTGRVVVNGAAFELQMGQSLLVRKGSERLIESTSERFSYLSVHRRRGGLMPTLGGRQTR
ncbi:MAG TPA: hypothetical protein VF600_03765 [Abditibacteriaceae bacterium]|jgi:mannose-6-phosphate isomerase-like protein (cupin superfamily)